MSIEKKFFQKIFAKKTEETGDLSPEKPQDNDLPPDRTEKIETEKFNGIISARDELKKALDDFNDEGKKIFKNPTVLGASGKTDNLREAYIRLRALMEIGKKQGYEPSQDSETLKICSQTWNELKDVIFFDKIKLDGQKYMYQALNEYLDNETNKKISEIERSMR